MKPFVLIAILVVSLQADSQTCRPGYTWVATGYGGYCSPSSPPAQPQQQQTLGEQVQTAPRRKLPDRLPADAVNPKPTPDKFATDEAYIEALVDWKLKQSQSTRAKKVPLKPGTLSACKRELQDASDQRDTFLADLTAMHSDNDKLSETNKALEESNAALTKKLEDALESNNKLRAEYSKMQDDYRTVVNKHNLILSEYISRDQQRVAEYNNLSRRFNSLLVYAVTKSVYVPPAPTVIYTPPPYQSISCTSQQIGTFTYTNCH